jgi:acyl-CoA thioesterase-1
MRLVQFCGALALITFSILGLAGSGGAALAAGRPLRIVALGDSLTAGYLLPDAAAFPSVLQRVLQAEGRQVEVENAGVSGDTASAGLDRLDWALGSGADLVIVELGANDMLRGIDPAITRKALAAIVSQLQARNIRVLLAGMVAAPGMGKDYEQRFNAIYPDLARELAVPLYPFFLQGIAGDPKFILKDGMHPNPEGVEIIVRNILPSVEAQLPGS